MVYFTILQILKHCAGHLPYSYCGYLIRGNRICQLKKERAPVFTLAKNQKGQTGIFPGVHDKKEKSPGIALHPGEENNYFVAAVVVFAVVVFAVVLVTGAVVATVVGPAAPLTTGCCATPVVTLTESVTLPFGAVVEPVERTLPSL